MLKKILILLLFGSSLTFAQTDSVELKHYSLNVNSNIENAKVFLDTTLIGNTPLENYSLEKGVYKLRVINPKSLLDWENENEEMVLDLVSDTTINCTFDYYYYFNSNPFDAQVYKSDSLLGLTPLRFFSPTELSGNLIFKKKNFKDFVFDLNKYDFETGANIDLQSKGKESINDIVYKNRGTQFKTRRNLFTISALGATSVAAGFFAVKFKSQANTAYDKYVATGDPLQLDESNSNDTYFVMSIILMQLAIGGLVYFLFFD